MRKNSLAIAAMLGATLAFPAPAITAMPGAQAPAAPAESLVIPVGGCHARVDFHYVPEFGYRTRHFHRGPRCRVVEYERFDDDEGFRCHRDAARHSHRGFGRTLHRHSRRGCGVRVLRPGPSGGGGACITLGLITVCEQ